MGANDLSAEFKMSSPKDDEEFEGILGNGSPFIASLGVSKFGENETLDRVTHVKLQRTVDGEKPSQDVILVTYKEGERTSFKNEICGGWRLYGPEHIGLFAESTENDPNFALRVDLDFSISGVPQRLRQIMGFIEKQALDGNLSTRRAISDVCGHIRSHHNDVSFTDASRSFKVDPARTLGKD